MAEESVQEYIIRKQQEMRQKKEELKKEVMPMVDMSYVTVEEYAEKMHVHAGTVRHQCCCGEIPNAVKRGNRWFIPVKPAYNEEDFNRLLKENARLKNTLSILKNILCTQEENTEDEQKYFTAKARMPFDRI